LRPRPTNCAPNRGPSLRHRRLVGIERRRIRHSLRPNHGHRQFLRRGWPYWQPVVRKRWHCDAFTVRGLGCRADQLRSVIQGRAMVPRPDGVLPVGQDLTRTVSPSRDPHLRSPCLNAISSSEVPIEARLVQLSRINPCAASEGNRASLRRIQANTQDAALTA
jgi:hypothetical protein